MLAHTTAEFSQTQIQKHNPEESDYKTHLVPRIADAKIQTAADWPHFETSSSLLGTVLQLWVPWKVVAPS